MKNENLLNRLESHYSSMRISAAAHCIINGKVLRKPFHYVARRPVITYVCNFEIITSCVLKILV